MDRKAYANIMKSEYPHWEKCVPNLFRILTIYFEFSENVFGIQINCWELRINSGHIFFSALSCLSYSRCINRLCVIRFYYTCCSFCSRYSHKKECILNQKDHSNNIKTDNLFKFLYLHNIANILMKNMQSGICNNDIALYT